MLFGHPPGQMLRRNQKNCLFSPSFVSESMILDLRAASVKAFRDRTDQPGWIASMIAGGMLGTSSMILTAASIARAAASRPASVRA